MNRNSVSLVIKVLLICSVFASLLLYWQEREQAQQDAAQFRTAVRAAGAGQWFWDIEKNVLRWDARMFELFHQSTQDWKWVDGSWEWQGDVDSSPAEFFGACVVEEDREFIFKELQRAIDTKGSYQAVFRVLGQDGNIYPIRSGGAVFGGGRYLTGLCLRAIVTGATPAVLDTTAIQAGPRSGPTTAVWPKD